jgi:hypothetical protein
MFSLFFLSLVLGAPLPQNEPTIAINPYNRVVGPNFDNKINWLHNTWDIIESQDSPRQFRLTLDGSLSQPVAVNDVAEYIFKSGYTADSEHQATYR